ncbi:MAG: tryptophan synthase subunit alpha [Ferruginibacter sp.]
MNNKLTQLFQQKNSNLLNVYCTAGYPAKDSTIQVLLALQKNGVDMIEVGMPYSDPIADGPVIQQSNMQALENGMTIELLFTQLEEAKAVIDTPIILMGYLNPVLQFGIEKFCKAAAGAGISGIILPDLPMHEFEEVYSAVFEKYNLSFIFLITPQTSPERIKKADKLGTGFLYAVSSSATTGTVGNAADKKDYFERISAMKLKNPLMIGFGINDRSSYETACTFARGAIIGSAYIKALGSPETVEQATESFLRTIR